MRAGTAMHSSRSNTLVLFARCGIRIPSYGQSQGAAGVGDAGGAPRPSVAGGAQAGKAGLMCP
jgi:hypothetical protein